MVLQHSFCEFDHEILEVCRLLQCGRGNVNIAEMVKKGKKDLYFSHTHTHTHIHTYPLTHTLSLSLSHTHTHTHTLSLSLSLSFGWLDRQGTLVLGIMQHLPLTHWLTATNRLWTNYCALCLIPLFAVADCGCQFASSKYFQTLLSE